MALSDEELSGSSFATAPSYIVAADNHNIANGDISMAEAISNGVSHATSFATAALISGVTSFRNTGVAINNFLGGDAEEIRTDEVIANYDSDLAAYYRENQQAVDTVGFIAGSFVPGLTALKGYNFAAKALNAAKAGRIGMNLEEATGLFKVTQWEALQAAKTEMTSSNATFNILSGNTLKAVASGFGEQAVQAAVFETAASATMFKSPIMESMDASDVASNVLWGAVFGGGIGGLLEGAASYGFLRRAKSAADIALQPVTHISEMRAGATADQRIILHADDKFSTPSDVTALDVEYGGKATVNRNIKMATLNNKMRMASRELANSDDVVGNQLADHIAAMPDLDTVGNGVLGLRSVSRVAEKDVTESTIDAITRKIANGTATTEDLAKLQNSKLTFTRMWGEGVGNQFDSLPAADLSIQDSLKNGQTITITSKGVKVGNGNLLKMTFDHNKPWDILKASQEEAEARYLFAYHSPPLKADAILTHNDFPMLEKAYMESAGKDYFNYSIKHADGSVSKLGSREELFNHITGTKDDLIERFKTASMDSEVISDPVLAEMKLKELTGVHFQVTAKDNGALAWTYVGNDKMREAIHVSAKHITRTPISRLVQAIKHEEGHNAWNLIDSLGFANAEKPIILKEAEKASREIRKEHWKQAELTKDYSYVRDPHELMADMFAWASMRSADEVKKLAPKFYEAAYQIVNPIPQHIVDSLALKARQLSSSEIARRLNMRLSAVEGTAASTKSADELYLANQSFATEHVARMQKAGVPVAENPLDILFKPQHVKMGYDTTAIKDVNGNVLEGIAAIKQKQVIFRQAAERTFAAAFGAASKDFFRMPEDVTLKATSEGAGASLTSFANGNYGSPASHFERIGQATHNLITARVNGVHAVMEPLLREISGDLKATLELSTILNRVRGTPEKYVLNEDGTGLILRGIKNQSATKPYLKVDNNAADEILFDSESVKDYVTQHIATNGARVSKFQAFRQQVGLQDRTDPNTFYAPPVDPKRYPHFAFVVDDSITGTGHMKMIHAATERELDLLISKVPTEGGLKVVTKKQSERFHEAYGDYQQDLALHENYLDSSLHRAGVSSQYFPITDGKKLVDDLMSWHVQKERQLVREGVSHLYSKEFEEFRNLGEQYTNLATSRYGRSSMVKHAEETVKNPYVDYIKTALDIGKESDSKLWTPLNRQLDQKASNIWNSITGAMLKTKSPEELHLVNTAMKSAGIKTAVYDAMIDGLANHTAPKGVLSSFAQKANALLASVTLRPDALNAVNNIVGSTVLTGTEMRAVLSAIEKGDSAAVGELSALAKITVPGTKNEILAPTKLVSNAIKNWFDPLLRETAFRDGFTSRHAMEYHSIVDELTLKGSESVSELNAKIKNAYDKTMGIANVAEKYTGNKFAEEFTRFVSADIMRQITDVAVKHGLMEPALAKSYIQTFVNRTQGNYLASQRPLMFTGPVGQAIGLFQTYQVNLIQQLLRHVADGNGKNVAMMMGLQSSIYGMHGLPAFDVLNTHLIGNASGNTSHQDIISTAYGTLGKQGADWLVYGAASNVLGLLHPDLKMNLYTRGDINPRQLTVIPTNPADVPIVNASTKFFSNLGEVLGKLGTGHSNPMVTILQGLEHNGVNRPLAGLAQTLEAFTNPDLRSFSTTNAGNLSSSNDLLTLANFGRILGAKPMDEAIAIDAGFRKSVYQAADADKRKQLGEVIKSTVIGGNSPTPDDINYFMESYTKSGGKQENFNKYMMGVYKQANTSQANEIAKALKTPYAKSMQELMGGRSMLDFTNTPISTSSSGE